MSTYRIQLSELRNDVKGLLDKLDKFDHENFDTISNFEDREVVEKIPPVDDDLVSNVTRNVNEQSDVTRNVNEQSDVTLTNKVRSTIPPPPPPPLSTTRFTKKGDKDYPTYTGEYTDTSGRASIKIERKHTNTTFNASNGVGTNDDFEFNEDEDDNEIHVESPVNTRVHFSEYDNQEDRTSHWEQSSSEERRLEQRRSRTFEEKQADSVAHLHSTGSVRNKIAEWNKMAHVSV